MNMASPAIFEWRITPEETTIVDTINGIRHIYTDGRSHPPADEVWPTKAGRSRGATNLVEPAEAAKQRLA